MKFFKYEFIIAFFSVCAIVLYVIAFTDNDTDTQQIRTPQVPVPENNIFYIKNDIPEIRSTNGIVLVVLDGFGMQKKFDTKIQDSGALQRKINNFIAGGADPLLARRSLLTGMHHSNILTAGSSLQETEILYKWLKDNNIKVGHFGYWPFDNITLSSVTDTYEPMDTLQDINVLLNKATEFINECLRDNNKFYVSVWPNRTNIIFKDDNTFQDETYNKDSQTILKESFISSDRECGKDVIRALAALDEDPTVNTPVCTSEMFDTNTPCFRSNSCVKYNYKESENYDIDQLKNWAGKFRIKSDKLIMLMTSDTGPESPLVDAQSRPNTPYRGVRRSLYRGGVKVVNLFDSHLRDQYNADFMCMFDWVPTVLQIFGVNVENKRFDGVDQSVEVFGSSNRISASRIKPVMLEWRYATPGNCVNESPRLLMENSKVRILVEPSIDLFSAKRIEIYSNEDTENFEFKQKSSSNYEKDIQILLQWGRDNLKSQPDKNIWEHNACSTTVSERTNPKKTFSQQPRKVPKHIIFIMADDEGYGDVGALIESKRDHFNALNVPYHYEADTPNLDALATQGAIFTDFHTASSTCTPTRSSFLTGRNPSDPLNQLVKAYPSKSSYFSKPGSPYANHKQLRRSDTLMSYLHTKDWEIGHFGKWHLGYGFCLESYKFTDIYCYSCENQCHSDGKCCNDEPCTGNCKTYYDTPTSLNNQLMSFTYEAAPKLVNRAIQFIQNAHDSGKSSYTNLWFNAPHAPLNIPITDEEEVLTSLGYGSASTPYTQDWNKHTKNEKYNHLSQLQTYRAFLKQKDTELGKLVQKLKELNIFEETMIVYTSDNGAEDEYKYYGTVGDSGPFRGRKRSNYNGGHRMPFIISWPNAIPNPVTFSEPITSSDWLKTVVSLVSNKNSNEIENNGAKYTQDFSCLFFEYDSTCQDLLRDRTLLFDSFDKQTSTCFDSSPRYAIRYADHKFYQNDRNANPKFQLFNVKNDPLELNDLSNTDLTLLSDMQQKFLDFIRNSDYYKDNVDDSWKNNDWNANNDFFVWTKSSESNMLAQCN